MATLLLSQGMPMFVAGDEWGRSQGGNNNAYCQDNEISWLDWDDIDDDGRCADRVREADARCSGARTASSIASASSAERSRRRSQGHRLAAARRPGVRRSRLEHVPRAEPRLLISGEADNYHVTASGEPEPDDTFFLVLNAHHEEIVYVLPGHGAGRSLGARARHQRGAVAASRQRLPRPGHVPGAGPRRVAPDATARAGAERGRRLTRAHAMPFGAQLEPDGARGSGSGRRAPRR